MIEVQDTERTRVEITKRAVLVCDGCALRLEGQPWDPMQHSGELAGAIPYYAMPEADGWTLVAPNRRATTLNERRDLCPDCGVALKQWASIRRSESEAKR